jgi:hypothetical protein
MKKLVFSLKPEPIDKFLVNQKQMEFIDNSIILFVYRYKSQGLPAYRFSSAFQELINTNYNEN